MSAAPALARPERLAIPPRVVLFHGAAAGSIRAALVAGAGAARDSLYCCSASERSEPEAVAAELEDCLVRARARQAPDAAPVVPLVVVAGEPGPGLLTPVLATLFQSLGNRVLVRLEWLGVLPEGGRGFPEPLPSSCRAYLVSRRFLDTPLDELALSTSLRYLAAAFTLSPASRMGTLGFDGVRAAPPGGVWAAGLEISKCATPAQVAAALEWAIAREIYPEFSPRVRRMLTGRGHGGAWQEALLCRLGAGCGSLPELIGRVESHLEGASLGLALRRIHTELANLAPPPDMVLPDDVLNSVFEVFPLPVLRYSAELSSSLPGRRIEEAIAAATRRAGQALLQDLRAEACRRHLAWRRPQLNQRGLAGVLAQSMGLAGRHQQARDFLFTPPLVSEDDRDELWTLPDSICHLNLLALEGGL